MSVANGFFHRGILKLFTALLLVTLAFITSPTQAQDEDTTFTARISGSSQVAPIATQASGELTATLDGDSLFVSGSFENLSDTYTNSHLHMGLAGQDGGVAIGLTPTLGEDETSGDWDIDENRFELTAEQKELLLNRELYVNVHSETYPAGEIRGQLLMEADAHYEAVITGGSRVPSVNTTAVGNLVAEVHGDSLLISGSFHGLTSPYANSHLHLGLAGKNGGVEIGLTPSIEADTAGTFPLSEHRFELTAEQQTALQERRLYVNIHSENYPAGEIRGQLAPRSDAYFEAIITGTAKVSPVATDGSGNLFAEVRGDSLFVTGAFEGLTSAFTNSHLHVGLAGESGGVEIGLNATTTNGDTSGTWAADANSFELTDERLSLLWDRSLYVNVHTEENPGGEIRGQVLPISSLYFQTTLSGLNEVDPDTSSATGGAVAELNDNRLIVSGAFSDLVADLATDIRGGAHLHVEGPGENGPIALDLDVTNEAELTSGEFAASGNMFTISADTVDILRSGRVYANVHSETFQGGEIRGQMLLSPNSAPDSTGIVTPEDSATVQVEGDPSDEYTATWDAAEDPNENEVVYIYQLSTDTSFADDSLVVNTNVGTETSFVIEYDSLATLLDNEGVEAEESVIWHQRVVASDGSDHTVGESSAVEFEQGGLVLADDTRILPTQFALKGNYPNPFNPTTAIQFDLPQQANVTVEVFDVMGRKVLVLPAREMAPGANHSVQVDASSLASGLYLYRVEADLPTRTRVETGKMMLVK